MACLWWRKAAGRVSWHRVYARASLFALFASVPALPAALEFDPAFVMRAAHSVVRIEAGKPGRGIQIGTGIVIAEQKVATACHVVRDARTIYVLYSGRRWKVSALRAMPERDLCLFVVPSLDAPPAQLRDSRDLKIGESVVAVGFGGGAGIQWSAGTVENLHRYDGAAIVQTSAAFNSGASGGALIDAGGRVVGVLSFRMRATGPQFYCVPVEWATQEPGDIDAGIVNTQFHSGPFWARQVDALPFFMRAVTLETEEQWEALRALCEAWQVAEPSNAQPAVIRGAIDSRFGRLIAARSALEQAVTLDPQNALAWSALVRVRLRLHDPAAAREAYLKVMALSAYLAGALLEENAALRNVEVIGQ